MDTSAFNETVEAFPGAELLPVAGATCQCYRVKLYGKLHFLKRLKPELATDPRHVAALNKEFETGYRLEHPHLVRYMSKSDDGILMEYVDGDTLTSFMAANPDYFKDSDNAGRFLRQLLDVVGYLHSHQIVHLDLKPDNILITRIGHDVKLIDLGYCYTDTYSDTMGRTDRYAAPEQLDGSPDVDARTDIYAIGRILQSLPVTSDFDKIIAGCTRHDKSQRYQSVSEILDQLDRRKPARRWLWLLLLLPLVALGGYLYQSAIVTPATGSQQDSTITQPADTLDVPPVQQPDEQQAMPSPDAHANTQHTEAPSQEVPSTSTVPEEPVNSRPSEYKTDGRAERLEKQVQQDIDDLYDMMRSGQLDPMNLMYMKQTLPIRIRELIELYRQEGNSAKVSEWYYKLDVVESVLSQIMS